VSTVVDGLEFGPAKNETDEQNENRKREGEQNGYGSDGADELEECQRVGDRV
jgi:hypothetical protein